MSESAIKLLGKQQQLQRLIERSLDNFKKLGRNKWTPAIIRARTLSLKETWGQFIIGHAELLKTIPETTQTSIAYFKDNAIEMTEYSYETTLDFMAECLEELEPPVSANQSVGFTPDRMSSLSLSHLPPISLPPFDGSYDQWEHFRDRFTALIISNPDLRNFARMHYLVSCLKGSALECVKELPVTGENFDIAWKALNARYENKRRLLSIHMSALLNLKSVSRDSASEIQTLLDKVNSSLTSLRNLQRTPADLWHDMLVHIISQKLDSATRQAWRLKSCDSEGLPAVDELLYFLKSRMRALEDYTVQPVKRSTGSSSVKRVSASTASASPSAVASAPAPAAASAPATAFASAHPAAPSPCPICTARHYFNSCPIFVKGSSSQRRDLAQQHRRCFNCLSSNHMLRECPSKYSCRLCKQRHHTLLHEGSDADVTSNAVSVAMTESSPQIKPHAEVTSMVAATKKSHAPVQVLLATAWISVRGASDRSVRVRALLDQGSEMTFISERLAQLLRLKRVRLPISVSGVGGVHAGTFQHASQILVSPLRSLSPTFAATALIMKTLTSYAPKRTAEISSLSYLRDLPWADSNPSSADPIDVILGADIYSDLILEGLRKGELGQPIAQNSVFGWVISGPTRSDNPSATPFRESSVLPALNVSANHCCQISSLSDEIKRFWEVEELPHKPVPSADDEQCELHFRTTHSRADDGRYVVRLPFKTGPPIEIGTSRGRAQRLFESLLRRFQAHPEHAAEYRDFMNEYEQLGHMRQAPLSTETSGQSVVIPHHPVFRQDSVTSRIRVVFNASSATSNGSSLNDHLLSGPKLQTDLPAIILRWRLFQFVCTADIAKMYRQIWVDARDHDYQRILWQPAPNAAIAEFQLLTVTYGMACAPFLALRALQQLVADDGDGFPRAVSILKDHIYVDDVLFGDDDVESLAQTRDQLIELLRRGGFELRKWASNSSRLLSDIDSDNHGLACSRSLSPDEKLKILGIGWSPAHDSFFFKVTLDETVPSSKRSILSVIAKLYDPVGWVTPVTITAKIIIQDLWKNKVSWDEVVPSSILTRWTRIYDSLSHLNGLQIPRWTGFGSDHQQTELHGFADASSDAYAAVVYLKVTSLTGKVTITMLISKSKVAPLKVLSIPRLELQAAVLLSQLIEFVRDSLKFNSVPCTCWTDSTVVLAWLRQHSARWKTFVANRVADIQSRLPDANWRHVSTHDNPADCASRGLLGDEILAHPLWWQGPSWLLRSHDEWPSTTPDLPANAPLEEKSIAMHVAKINEPFDIASRYSSWPKLIRVTAYMLKFISLCRRTKLQSIQAPSSALSSLDCRAAKLYWIKVIQADVFSKELSALINNQPLPTKGSITSLQPFLDRDGIIRVGGRLRNAPLPFDVRHPILLASHSLVRLIIAHAHIRSLHAGLQLTLSTVRREYWIIRARSIVRLTIHNCVVCTRERASTPSQIMGDLPAARVSAPNRCFSHCGIDYAGPVLVRASGGRGIKSRKAYIALFVCLASRAIHLELVSDYSTPAFLNAYSRFCARRGLPHAMYSDNGTTFVGANRELASAYRAALRDPNFQNQTATDNVTWHFIPPSAPHFGGLWEAGVRSVKHHLRRVLGAHTLTYEELSTLLCRIEACLNSRPIAPLSDSPDDYSALTPGHFLIGSALTMSPEESTLELNENRLTRWQLVRHLTERMWKLWYDDYINTLQQRNKWRTAQHSLSIGQLVLIKNSTVPPCKWELGRVVQVHPGADGLTRVVTVKTAATEYKRPIVKLCVLPVRSESIES